MNVRLGLHITWLHLFTSSLNRNTSRTHSLRLRLSIHIWYIFPWQQIPLSGSHTELNSGVIQHYNSQGHLQTHSSHALTSSHTVNSPSSLEVINDFPWLLSSSPSTVNPLFFIEAPPTSLLSHLSPCHFGKHRSRHTTGRTGSPGSRDKADFHDTVRLPADFGRYVLSCVCVCHV